MEAELKVKLMIYTPEPEKMVATAAKLCYSAAKIEELQNNLTIQNSKKFIDKLMQSHHESPLEHVSFTFALEGVSRSLTHQLVRHRLASYSQQSQRYVESAEFSYIVPESIKHEEEAYIRYIESMEQSQEAYNAIVDVMIMSKCKPYVPYNIDELDAPAYLRESNPKLYNSKLKECYEDARYVLPNGAETRIIVTMNIRSLFNFFKERCCDRAQWEIRHVAEAMHKACKEVAPDIFKYAGPSCVYGKCKEGSMCCGQQLIKKQIYA